MTRNSLFTAAAALVLCAVMALPALSAAPAAGTAPAAKADQGTAARQTKAADVNGHVWQDSDNAAKLSFLLGVENAIAMEYALAQALAGQQGRPVALSPFQQGWMTAFQDSPRQQIVNRIDAFYTAHPDQRDRHVFDVIWTDMITPVYPAGRTAGK